MALTLAHPLAAKPKSKGMVELICSCGRSTLKRWENYANGHTSSCGKCNLLSTEHFRTARYGKLRMRDPKDVHAGSNKVVIWLCDCGRESKVPVVQVTSGKTSSCGRCNLLSAEHFRTAKYGKLRMKNPQDVLPSSHIRVIWTCDCGKESRIPICDVVNHNRTSCGQCNLLSAEHFRTAKYGKLRMKNPHDAHAGSDKTTIWLCDCGKESTTKICYVVSGETTSCGRCSVIQKDQAIIMKFGRLRLKDPVEIYPGSHVKTTWVCDCGGEVKAYMHNVTRGHTISCGRCYDNATSWYLKNRDTLLRLRPPITPSQIPPGFMIAVESIQKTGIQFSALCGVCGTRYKPLWDNVRLGKSLTCGCSSNRVSMGQKEMSEFIKALGFETLIEHKVGTLSYDIFISGTKLLIEFNGLKWHSSPEARKRDVRKYENAIEWGHHLLSIFEDEWALNKARVKDLIVNTLGCASPTPLRPSGCSLNSIPGSEANSFYEKFHYIGPCRPKVSYGVFLQGRFIACCSFSHPTRQSKHDWELVRMASDPEFRVHGIWSKLLKRFCSEHHPSSVVSFSDNRLFSGAVYEKMGFRYDGDVPPDYYWVKGGRRFHKSALRKRGEERASGLTERELREAQGYRRIWDLGKKRWVLSRRTSSPD